MEIMPKTKRKGINMGFLQVLFVAERGGWGGVKPGNDLDQKLDTTSPKRSILGHYKGTNSSYNMVYKLYGSEDEEKAEDEFTSFLSTLKAWQQTRKKLYCAMHMSYAPHHLGVEYCAINKIT